ncbi:multicopper oxidase [Nonomuraea polychroma]|uniref:Multicopper oxidase n=1 Tax=Nonomuraea polychroma TaxID=46176 RepID=A0A438LYP7_9ACTN|nr:multicopper oxidase [Nonomuraea polychroma]
MRAVSRRAFLGVLGGAGLAAAGCGALAETSGQLLASRLPLPRPFTVPLPVPDVVRPARPGRYEVTQRVARVEIVPGTTTEVWGYGGTFPGPTFELRCGEPVTVAVRNELPVPTSTHLHGGVNPPDSDGYPADLVVPAGYGTGHHGNAAGHDGHQHAETRHHLVKDYHYPVDQPAATLWYHDHRMDHTAPQVWRGLAGMALVRDAEEDALPLPRDERELPLMICDRSFDEDGSFRYPDLRAGGHFGSDYMEGVEGDVILVNGAPWPVAEVTATRYRLRLLNASNARRYRLALVPGGRFTQVGSDSGLLAAPVAHDTIPIAPGERYDVVVDFAAYPAGSPVTLVNTLADGPAWARPRSGASPATSTIPCTCTWPTSRCSRATAGRRPPPTAVGRTRWTCARTRSWTCSPASTATGAATCCTATTLKHEDMAMMADFDVI